MSDRRTTNPANTVATAPRRDAVGTQVERAACLVVIYGDDLGRRIPLGEEAVTIGRTSACDFQIDQESVSRTHCEIRATPRGHVLRDNASTNGTWVNDRSIDETKLHDGDQVKIGRTILKFLIGTNIELQYHEEIYRMMMIDGLTQVYNKRYFDESLDKELSRARRYGRSFSLILFDIDYFKSVNDQWGHLAGDAALRQLAQLIASHIRRDDVLARTGGEEFGIITPEIGQAGAMELAEKLRALVEAADFHFESTPLALTISLGVTEWTADMQSTQAMIAKADEQLYKAKGGGRNRVVG